MTSPRTSLSSAPDQLELTRLFHGVSLGDESDFGELYRRTRPRVDAVVRRTVRCPHQSDEVVQEVYLEVWQRADRYDPSRGSVLGWLSMVAHRRAVDRVRTAVSAAARDGNDAARSEADRGDVWEQVESRLDALDVRLALDRLTARQREALSLTYLAGYTQRQAAELAAVPLGTFKTRLRDGLTTLRHQLAAA